MDVDMNATSAVTSVAAEQVDSSGVSSKTEADYTSDGETGGSHLGLVNDTSVCLYLFTSPLPITRSLNALRIVIANF